MTNLIEVLNLHKKFPITGSSSFVQAINDVSFSIGKGETLGLVGESGSGKTTVGGCILGLIDDYEGSVRFSGQQLLRDRASRILRGEIQMVFQEPGESLDPRFRIGLSIEEPLLALGVEANERRSRMLDAAELVGLPKELLELYPAELSAGQQQRVGIARAMITHPKLIVLDEPTSALDPNARADIIELLMQIQKDIGTSYLFISHDLSTVRFISNRVAIMYLGMIVEQGDTASVFAQPRHPYSIGLLSAVLLPHPKFKFDTSVSLAGEIPSPINLPKGCFLESRCPFSVERCRTEMPPPSDLDGGHIVHCFRHQELAKRDDTSDIFSDFQLESERILSFPKPKLDQVT
jgi:oligopeptide/dipeptide ABC transporter ATP-binding protein